jgi:hypothetical protein
MLLRIFVGAFSCFPIQLSLLQFLFIVRFHFLFYGTMSDDESLARDALFESISDSSNPSTEKPGFPPLFADTPPNDFIYQPENTAHHRLYVKSTAQAAGRTEPPVLWSATVYSARDDGPPKKVPTAIYYNDLPLNIECNNSQDITPGDKATNKSEIIGHSTFHPIKWEGCVFEISCWAVARFPVATKSAKHYRWASASSEKVPPPPFSRPDAPYFSRSNIPTSPKSQLLTSKFEALKFEDRSPRSLVIKSPYLHKKLRDLAGYYPSFFDKPVKSAPPDFISESGFIIRDPWGILYHRFPEMQAFIEAHPPKNESQESTLNNDEAEIALQREHLYHLYQFLKPTYESRVLPCQRALEHPNPKIAFDMLWYALRPGIDVYIQHGQSTLACVVTRIASNLDYKQYSDSRNAQLEREYWMVDLWYLDSDGQRIGRRATSCRVSPYSGVRNLTSLPICPATIWDTFDHGERRKRILKRSSLLATSLKNGHLLAKYDGPVDDGKRYVSRNFLTLSSTNNASTLEA